MSQPTSTANASPSTNPPPSSSATIIDDKSPHCIPFILSQLGAHHSTESPFFIGLNGVQGAGKTTLVSALASTLQARGLPTLVCSIDDLYLKHADQVALAAAHRTNKLVQYRGEPGTHDMVLAKQLFAALKQGHEVKVPMYDKSAYNGAGDRVPMEQWQTVNGEGQEKIRVVIFEGWCVGFRALPAEVVARKREGVSVTLRNHSLEDLLFVNQRLESYDVITDCFDAFIHIDAEETGFVYEWRLQQESALRRERGSGMSDEKVREFVDGYYPAYELYTDGLRKGVLQSRGQGHQLRLVVGKDRRVKDVISV